MIVDQTDRNQAIDDLFNDIERIQHNHPAKNVAIILYQEGNGIDDLPIWGVDRNS